MSNEPQPATSTKLAHNALDLTGQRFGRLTAIKRVGKKPRCRQWAWEVTCDCGKIISRNTNDLTGGRVRSCGCLARDSRSHTGRTAKKHKKHGLHGTPEYRAWDGAIGRCHRPSTRNYHNYGGRGIAVCDAWRASFAAFYTDLGPRPSAKHSLERINNDGNYEPGNCRWATKKEQLRNKRTNKLVTYKGETMCLADMCDKYGVNYEMVWFRLWHGWTTEDAIEKPKSNTGRPRKVAA